MDHLLNQAYGQMQFQLEGELWDLRHCEAIVPTISWLFGHPEITMTITLKENLEEKLNGTK